MTTTTMMMMTTLLMLILNFQVWLSDGSILCSWRGWVLRDRAVAWQAAARAQCRGLLGPGGVGAVLCGMQRLDRPGNTLRTHSEVAGTMITCWMWWLW
jgi:hypothetical protein